MPSEKAAIFNNNHTLLTTVGEMLANTVEFKAFQELLHNQGYGPRSARDDEGMLLDLNLKPDDPVVNELLRVLRTQPKKLRGLLWSRFSMGEDVNVNGNDVLQSQEAMEPTMWEEKGDEAMCALDDVEGNLNAVAEKLGLHWSVSYGGGLGDAGGTLAARREWMRHSSRLEGSGAGAAASPSSNAGGGDVSAANVNDGGLAGSSGTKPEALSSEEQQQIRTQKLFIRFGEKHGIDRYRDAKLGQFKKFHTRGTAGQYPKGQRWCPETDQMIDIPDGEVKPAKKPIL